MKKAIIPIMAAAGLQSASAAITLIHEYTLGEPGSVATDNQPVDNVGSQNFTNSFGATNTSVATSGGAIGPGSYLSTTGGSGFSGATNTLNNNIAFGIYARQSTLSDGTIFMTNGTGAALKIQAAPNGWAASVHDVAWVGDANGTTGSFTANEWVHLALVVRNNQINFFIDGVDQGNAYNNSGNTAVFNNMTLLNDVVGGNTFTGDIDHLRIVTFDATDDNNAAVVGALAVPEPTSTALVGLAGLGLLLRRRN